MFKKNIVLTLLLMVYNGFSQKMELGKVTVAELQEKEFPNDPSAPAAILFKNGSTKIEYLDSKGFEMVTTVSTKIKIYKKEGYEWANHAIEYYLPSNFRENVSIKEATTYNLVDGKVVKTKLKSDGEFDEKVNKYWGRKKVTLPAVKEGSIVELEYVIRSPNFGTFKKWEFQTSIPVVYSEFKTYIPEYYNYNANFKGSIFPKKTTTSREKTIIFNEKERSEGYVVSTNFSQSKVNYQEQQTVYVCTNVPALKDEKFVNNIDNYTAGISHELSFIKYPNSAIKNFASDWKSVVKTIYEAEDFGDELKKTGYFEADLKTVTEGLKTQPEIVAAIFNHVKSTVKWNNYYSYYCNDGVKTAYKNKTGNVAEINLMLTAMLRHSGINAHPVLISTRSNGIAYFPTRYAFNYVITAIENPDGVILLDATEKFATPNVLPLRDLNWIGRIVRKDGTSDEIDLIPKSISKETVFMNVSINSDGIATGKIRKQLTDHTALLFRQKNVLLNKDTYLENLESSSNNIEISEYSRENDLEFQKAIVENFSFRSDKDVEIIDGKMYVSPMLFFRHNENPFRQEKREYPVDFGFPTQDKYNISIEIPEGYKVETIPLSSTIITGDDVGIFKYVIGQSGNKIQINVSDEMNAAILPPDYYDVLKEYFQKMIDKQNEKIVFIKS